MPEQKRGPQAPFRLLVCAGRSGADDVVVTVVGGMGGEECYKSLRDSDPEVRAIISTGYENDAMAQAFLDQGFCGYLTRPYRVADLGKVLKTVLG